MPSQQMPQSSKFETLPADLKEIAERLVRKKFNIPHEPEVVKRKPKRPKNPIDSLEPLLFEIRDITGRGKSEIFTVSPDMPSYVIHTQVMNRMKYLTSYYGGRYEVRNISHEKTYKFDFPEPIDLRPLTSLYY